jgi:hypothetical protein
MADNFRRSPAIAMQDLLVEAMKRKRKRLNALAAEVLVGLGMPPKIGQYSDFPQPDERCNPGPEH